MNPEFEDLNALLALPPDDPRRIAFEATPRGRAQLAAFREFLAPTSVPAGADRANAHARLGAVLDVARRQAEAGSVSGTIPGSEPAPFDRPVAVFEPVVGSGDSWLARLAAWWLAPARRPVLATAGLLVVATVGLAWLRVTPMPERQVSALRGDSQESGVQVLEPQRWNGGRRVNLRWEAVAGADAYRVRFLSDELEEIGFAGPLRETHYDLTAAPPAVTGRSTVIYQIEALQGLDVIATSATRSYTRP